MLLCWWRKWADDSLSHRRVQLIKDLRRAFGGECDAIKAGPSLRATPDVTIGRLLLFSGLAIELRRALPG